MKRGCVWVLVVLAFSARADVKHVRGRVTYVAAGTVYTSLGRDAGIQDSTLLFVISGKDTVATLKVFAVSSKSSACRVVRSDRSIRVADDVAGVIEREESPQLMTDSTSSQHRAKAVPLPNPRALPLVPVQEEFVSVKGRVSAQLYTSVYDNTLFNVMQPGLVMNLRGMMRDVPLKLDIYANFRMLSTGTQSLFSKKAINQSRIYGLSLTYDDGEHVFSVGRIIPSVAPSLGYIDGGYASKRFGDFVIGGTAGFQPAFNLRSVSTDFKKFALFAQYLPLEKRTLSVSVSYARTYFRSSIDRELGGILVNSSLSNNLFLYANAEIDLRRKSGGDFILSPRLTSAYVNLNYRITRSVGIGIGADASRPYYGFESVRLVPDTLLRDELRTGVSFNMNVFLPGGISLSNTYTPRNSRTVSFGKEYSNYSSINLADLFSSGVNLRANLNLNANQFTSGNGYGIAAQRTFWQTADLTFRFQQNRYRVKQTDLENTSTTLGGDMMIFITNTLSLVTTYERLAGFGTVSHSVFAEVSVRL